MLNDNIYLNYIKYLTNPALIFCHFFRLTSVMPPSGLAMSVYMAGSTAVIIIMPSVYITMAVSLNTLQCLFEHERQLFCCFISMAEIQLKKKVQIFLFSLFDCDL